jgi:hypothetical protein
VVLTAAEELQEKLLA